MPAIDIRGTKQLRIFGWVCRVFGLDVATNRVERGCRFVEEAIEVGQSTGLSREQALKILERVYSRPVGELPKEIGGAVVTLYALSECVKVDMDMAGADEFDRVLQIPQEEWDRRHAAKIEAGTAVK